MTLRAVRNRSRIIEHARDVNVGHGHFDWQAPIIMALHDPSSESTFFKFSCAPSFILIWLEEVDFSKLRDEQPTCRKSYHPINLVPWVPAQDLPLNQLVDIPVPAAPNHTSVAFQITPWFVPNRCLRTAMLARFTAGANHIGLKNSFQPRLPSPPWP